MSVGFIIYSLKFKVFNLKLLFCLMYVCSISTGCYDPVEKTDKQIYFDMEVFFENEIERLKANNVFINKTVKLNNQQEEQIIDKINWEEELQLFITSNINKNAFYGNYDIDSTSELNAVIYRALDKDYLVQLLKVQYNEQQEIAALYIHRSTQNYFKNATEVLEYISGQHYRIQKQEKILLQDPIHYFVEGVFVTP